MVSSRPSERTSLFFTLCVVSFYSLLKNVRKQTEPKITDLIYVRGFDIDFGDGNDGLFKKTLANAQAVASSTGTRLVPVSTNLKHFTSDIVHWRISHGSALASVVLAFGDLFSSAFLASSCDYQHLYPLGSHPDLDPLWSTERTKLIHDGCEANRIEKVRSISDNALVLKTVRICFENPDKAYNYGRCRKCTLTMLILHILGVLPQCATLPDLIDEEVVRNLVMPEDQKFRLVELLNGLGTTSPPYRRLKEALEEALARSGNENELNRSDAKPTRTSLQLRRDAVAEIEDVIDPGKTIILVDEEILREGLAAEFEVLPFLEHDGEYWGPPVDDLTAIREMERLRKADAEFFVFA